MIFHVYDLRESVSYSENGICIWDQRIESKLAVLPGVNITTEGKMFLDNSSH